MRVTVTVPAYLERQFEVMSEELGLSRQDTLLHCFTVALAVKADPPELAAEQELPDLYMLSAPERLKIYTFSDSGSCLRGEEIGEYHEIERGDKYAWVRFSRHSKEGAEGWELGKNGKLCESCYPYALRMWTDGNKSFSQ